MFNDPEKNLQTFSIDENMVIADFGAGTGFYTIASARMVPKGKVYALEVQKDLIETIKLKARYEHLSNIECIWSNVEKIGGTKLADSIIDRAIVSNVLFQIEDKKNFVEEIKRVLKPGGKLLLIDHCPDKSHLKIEMVSKEKAREMFEARGFVFEKNIDAGTHNYGIIFSIKK
ncbi:MAG: class I SAM-dependent methyltransferase [Candidatus Pacebacteria bacterium]|nr:class I SAM-dependent methyltransferase [Candidatus Paceibacterota bacterium]MCF7862987.1 class I SAM-dependent methyltransferase [Candidatus Paceibacterota bacterium]